MTVLMFPLLPDKFGSKLLAVANKRLYYIGTGRVTIYIQGSPEIDVLLVSLDNLQNFSVDIKYPDFYRTGMITADDHGSGTVVPGHGRIKQ